MNRLILPVLLILSSCAIGPDHTVPELTSLEQGSFSSGRTFSNKQPLVTWWEVFNDHALSELIRIGVEQNRTVAQALARVNTARALARATRAELFPGARLTANYTEAEFSGARFSGDSDERFSYELYDANVEALWEIDLFGRIRRKYEAANAAYGMDLADLHGAILITVGEIARVYFELCNLEEELRLAHRHLTLQEQTLEIVRARYKAGTVSELDLARSETQQAQTASDVPILEAAKSAYLRQLQVLLGESPLTPPVHDLRFPSLPTTRDMLHVGDPKEVIRKRPDIQRAERELAHYTANIGVAIGDLFPTLSLSGAVSVEASRFSDLPDAGATHTFGPSLSWNILNFQRLRARVQSADTRAEQALYHYEQTVLQALEEVQSAMAQLVGLSRRYDHLSTARRSAEQALALAEKQYQEGALDLLAVLDTQRTLLTVQQSHARTLRDHAIGIVTLYKALGGGWEFAPIASPELGSPSQPTDH